VNQILNFWTQLQAHACLVLWSYSGSAFSQENGTARIPASGCDVMVVWGLGTYLLVHLFVQPQRQWSAG